MKPPYGIKKASFFIGLIVCMAQTACPSLSDQIVVKTGPEGAVFLERPAARGTTVRYSGQLKSFRANHPISLAPHLLEKALTGIHVGIAPSDGDHTAAGIKPTPLFSPREIAFLAPAIASALEKAEPDQRVKFEVGSEADRSDGTLYVEKATIRFGLSHFHSPARRRDDNLSIYILSMRPEQAQGDASGQHYGLDIDPEQPKLAIHYDALGTIPSTNTSPSGPPAAAEQSPAPHSDARSMKEIVDKQAQELDALKAELEALKKQMQRQRPSVPSPSTP